MDDSSLLALTLPGCFSASGEGRAGNPTFYRLEGSRKKTFFLNLATVVGVKNRLGWNYKHYYYN